MTAGFDSVHRDGSTQPRWRPLSSARLSSEGQLRIVSCTSSGDPKDTRGSLWSAERGPA